MASGGRINGTVTNRSAYFSFYCEWSAIQNNVDGYSDVTVSSFWKTNNTTKDFDTVGNRPASITINGKTFSIENRFDCSPWTSNPYLIQTATHRVYHDEDGTKSIVISARANGYVKNSSGQLVGTSSSLLDSDDCTASSTVILEPIAKGVAVISAESFTDEDNPIIKFNNAKEYTLRPCLKFYKDGVVVKSIYRDIGNYTSPYQFKLTETERTELRNLLNDNVTFFVAEGIESYDGDRFLGYHSLTRVFTIVNATPSTEMVLEPVGCPDWARVSGESIFIQGKTKVGATFKNTLKKEATLKSNTLTVEGKPDSTSPYQSNNLVGAGQIMVRGNITDSRNLSYTASQDIYVYPYTYPSICYHTGYDRIICKRCDKDGNFTNDGTYIRVIMGARWSPLKNNINTSFFWYRIQSTDYDSDWIKPPNYPNGTNGKCDFDIVLQNEKGEKTVIDTNKAYTVLFCIMDRFNSESYWHSEKIPMEEVTFHLKEGGGGAAFGEYATEEKVLKLKDDWDLKVKGKFLKDYIVQMVKENLKKFIEDTAKPLIPAQPEEVIVEIGTYYDINDNLIWTYRKWKNGFAECWGNHTVSDISINVPWGGMYTHSYPIGFPAFPVDFVEIPDVHLTWESAYSAFIGGIENKSSFNVGEMYLYRGRSAESVSGKFRIYAYGRWK